MPIEKVHTFARENVETEVGRAFKHSINATEESNAFVFSGEIGASVPIDGQAVSIIKVSFTGGIGWQVTGKPVRARLSWKYIFEAVKFPSGPGQSLTYTLWYQALSNEFGPIDGVVIPNGTIRPMEEGQRPIFDLKPGSSYSMTAELTMECRVPEQDTDVTVGAWLSGARWMLEEV